MSPSPIIINWQDLLDIAHLPNAFISEQEEFMAIHTATPGPVGLAALLIARILKLPCYSTYHTSIPQYARHLTEDPDIEELAWKYICWYYDQMDRVYVPSQSTRQELIGKGLAAAYASAELFIFPSTGYLRECHPEGPGLRIAGHCHQSGRASGKYSAR